MNTEQCVTSTGFCRHVCGIKCVSWASILAGAFVAIGLAFLLNLFSTAIGLSIYKVSPEGVSTLTVGGMLGFAIGIIASMFFAGWVAGFFGRSHCEKKCCGALYGFTTWCVALVLVAILMMPLSQYVTGYSHYLANTEVTTVQTNPNTGASEKKVVTTMPTKEEAGDLSKGAYVLFIMFFLGALASTCGGHVGVWSCHNKECCNSNRCSKCNKPV